VKAAIYAIVKNLLKKVLKNLLVVFIPFKKKKKNKNKNIYLNKECREKIENFETNLLFF